MEEGRTDTTKFIIVFRTFVKVSKGNMRICKQRKLDNIFENSKTSRVVENLIASQVGFCS
jgi:hypothetical protein